MSGNRRLKKRAGRSLSELRLIISRAGKGKKSPPPEFEDAQKLAAEVGEKLKAKDYTGLAPAVEELEQYLREHLSRYLPNPVWETIKALLMAVAIALAIRWVLVEPFRIPSGSMITTLLIGDQLFVNKTPFGPDLLLPYLDPDLNQLTLKAKPRFQVKIRGHELVFAYRKLWVRRPPRRGEVIVFRFPQFPGGPQEDYIKRVVGLPGDRIEIRQGRLYINDHLQPEAGVGPYTGPTGEGGCEAFELFDEELESEPQAVVHHLLHCSPRLTSPPYYRYGPVTVPEGMVLGMGDNRDRSYDSRFWGFIPISHLKGTAMFIHLPLDPDRHYLPRWERFFKWVR